MLCLVGNIPNILPEYWPTCILRGTIWSTNIASSNNPSVDDSSRFALFRCIPSLSKISQNYRLVNPVAVEHHGRHDLQRLLMGQDWTHQSAL